MNLVDRWSKRIGESVVRKRLNQEVDVPVGIEQEIDILQELRNELVKKDNELERSRLMWDRTFDSIIDNVVLIGSDRCIQKVNDAFYHCVETEMGHVEFIGMLWEEFRSIARIDGGACAVDECFNTGVRQEIDVAMHGKLYHVTAQPIYAKDGTSRELVGVVRASRDITKTEREKVKLERRSRIYHAISEMTKTLVNHNDWDSAVKLTLGDLGRSVGASRVYLYKNEVHNDHICAMKQHIYHNNVYRKCQSGDITDCINYDLVPDWQSRMEAGLSASGNIVECDICPHKEKCVCQSDVLVCAVPVFVDKKWWGFIGFDYTNGTRVWKDEDETLLRIAADILGGVIYHRTRYWNTVEVLEECEDQLSGVNDD